MRGVLGILFVGVGITLGYLILTGKFPSNAPVIAPAPPPPTPEQPKQEKSGSDAPNYTRVAGPSTVIGIPTVQHLYDLSPSRGGVTG